MTDVVPAAGSTSSARSLPRRIGRVLAIGGAIVTVGCAGLGNSGTDGASTQASVAVSAAAPSTSADRIPTQVRAEVNTRADGEPLPTITVWLNSEVELVVADPTATVHLVGYERYANAEGGSSILRFVADRAGRFVVERDETGVALVEVEVLDPDAP